MAKPINQKKPLEKRLNREELAEQARAMMPQAMEKLECILLKTGSDVAALQAFRAIKETAYGKELLDMNMATEFESLTDDELKAAIKAELRAYDDTINSVDKRGTPAPVNEKPSCLV